MKQGIPRISVRIITYNQEKLIGRAIESALAQKEYIYQICILDDLSTDNNWEVITEYAEKYPDLIKAYQNEVNLGIMQNCAKRWTLPPGDINYDLSGDDEIGEGWFQKVIEFIDENNIDYENELFCIYGDALCVYPNGDSFTIKNKAIRTQLSPLKLYERGLVNSRSTCYSKHVMSKFQNPCKGRSLSVENALDGQLHAFSEKTYYIPHVGNLYYSNIGVTSNLNDEAFKDYEMTMVYAFEFFKSLGIQIDKYDEGLPQFNIAVKRMRKNKSIKSIWNVIKAYWKSYDPKVGFRDIQLKKYIFAIARRIPHKKPLQW